MKASAIVCAVLAGTFGLGSVAHAQSWREQGHERGQRGEQHQQRGDPRWDGRRDHDRREGWNHQQPRQVYEQPRYVYQQPRHVYQQPRYGYQQPYDGYQQPSHRFYRGSYLPHEYRSRGYHVNNWQSYPGLYAPAYGQQWVNVNGDFLLVALATGLIANALMH
jgi:Ni/Co efflux regulator RcnB